MNQLNAEIIAIGTEILLGEITDTNSVYLAQALRDLGINLYFMTSVGDNEGRIADAIRIALSRAKVVITCGGLGPTIDDMTRQGVAAATDRGLTFHQPLLDKIAERFEGFRATMTENNRRQAYIPDHAVIIENPVGTAPAFVVEQGENVVISLPGVPREMKFLMQERIIPYLREHYGLGEQVIKKRVLKTAGIGESALDEAIGKDLLEASNPSIGLAAHSGQVDIRITAKANTLEEADAMIAAFETQVRARVGDFIFGTDGATIEAALVETLKARSARLAIIEAGVGSIVTGRLAKTDIEKILVRARLQPTVEAFAAELGLSPDLPLREMAERGAELLAIDEAVDAAIVVLSRSQSDEDRADKEEQSAIAVRVEGKTRSRSYGFGAGNETAEAWFSTWTLSMVWRMLRETPETNG